MLGVRVPSGVPETFAYGKCLFFYAGQAEQYRTVQGKRQMIKRAAAQTIACAAALLLQNKESGLLGYRRTLPGVAQQSGDGQADGGDIGDDQQAQQQHQQEGDDLFDQLSEGDVADAAGHEQVDTHRRGDEADGQVDHHDQAEVDDVHAEVGYHGVQDGGQDETNYEKSSGKR